jgi:UDP:flavonoid glycosyltransferase YjiC (YdhE family)
MRALVATVDAGGNNPPTLAVLRELVDRGHDVRVLAHATQQAELALAGVAARPWTSPRPWDPRPVQPDARSLLAWLWLAADPGYAQDLRTAALLEQPDVVLVDCMIPGALRGARATSAPVAVLTHAFSDYWHDQWAGRGPMALWQRLRGCSPLQPRNAPDLFLLMTSAELDDAERLRTATGGAVAQVGPALPRITTATAQQRAHGPLLVSLSTLGYPGQREALQRVVDAVAPLGAPVLATVANEADRRGLRVPPGVTVHGFVPHDEVLPGVRAVVGHGGHGTTMLALAHDLPVLVLPMSRYADQPLVGRAVESAGAGLAVPRDSSVDVIRAAARRMLDAEFSTRAAAVGRRLRRTHAAAEAADSLESLAERHHRASG